MDDTVLDIDQIEKLISFCPTKEEMELLNVKSFSFYLLVSLFWMSFKKKYHSSWLPLLTCN